MLQILCHLWGDYILQSQWMAENKTKRHWPAFVHALIYSLCFVPLCWHPDTYHGYEAIKVWQHGAWASVPAWNFSTTWASSFHPLALVVIFGTHFLIDRYRLARYVVWAKNRMFEPWWAYRQLLHRERYARHATPPFCYCDKTGYAEGVPIWLATWLLIFADNTLHLTINYLALRFL
ncbi:MAG TPA: DUF3307 domain-containing protein [Candidatus Angelobacter sp.]|nr:DUF3307 domain-containing protein [Candidatus Angelobacter sp.]